MKTLRWIDSSAALDAWLQVLQRHTRIAVDTESNSFHRYKERVCLIQMTAGDEDVIIDPLAGFSLEPLRVVFEDPHWTKIFHDAGYDLVGLHRDWGWKVHGLFDTMWACRLLGMEHFGLASVLEQHWNVKLDKKWQRSDWQARPLSAEQLDYARQDTHYLPALAERLEQDLNKAERWPWAIEDFGRIPETALRISVAAATQTPPEPFWRVKGVQQLSPQVRGHLRVLAQAREQIARDLDRPVFRVLADAVLLDLAEHPPRSMASFHPRSGMGPAAVNRFGPIFIKALLTATPVVETTHARVKRRSGSSLPWADPARKRFYEALRKMRRSIAETLQIDPDTLLGNAVLDDISKTPPTVLEDLDSREELRGWRGPYIKNGIWEVCQKFTKGSTEDTLQSEVLADR